MPLLFTLCRLIQHISSKWSDHHQCLVNQSSFILTSQSGSVEFSHFLFTAAEDRRCVSLIVSYQAWLDYIQAGVDRLTDTYLTFFCPSDEDTGPVVRVGFLFLGLPGPRRAGLRGVSSFLLPRADVNRPEEIGESPEILYTWYFLRFLK